MQGIVQIGVIFNQIGPITLSFAIINLLEASVRCQKLCRAMVFPFGMS